MPEVIEDLLPPGQLPPTLRHQPAQRKPVKERASGEQDDQQNGEEEPGDGVADDNDAGRPDVETGAIAYGLPDTKRNRDQICQQRHPDPERHRYRQLLLDQLQYADIAEIAFSKIKADVIPEHQPKALVGRLVEAKLLFKLLDELGVETLCAPVLRARRIDLRGPLRHAAAAEVASRRAGNARRCAGLGSRQLGNHLLDGPARRKLHHDECNKHDPEHRRDHEQNAADDICAHCPISMAYRDVAKMYRSAQKRPATGFTPVLAVLLDL